MSVRLIVTAAVPIWLLAVCLGSTDLRAQDGGGGARGTIEALSPAALEELAGSARPDNPATLLVANRPVVVLRAAVLDRGSADCVRAAGQLLAELAREGRPLQVTSEVASGASFIIVGGRRVFAIVPADLDRLLSETIETKTAAAAARLQQALDEIVEASRPRQLLLASAQALAVTTVCFLLLWVLGRVRSRVRATVEQRAQQRLSRSTVGDALVRRTHLLQHVGRSVTVLLAMGALAVVYVWLTFVLRRFPYTRPWGESLRAFLLERVVRIGEGILGAVPDLVMVVLILAVMRLVLRWARLLFFAAEEGRITLPGIHPETAAVTRKLLTVAVWLLALAICYPYLPGSGTEAFKGVSVFVGLVVSLGSSGIVNQLISGLTVTYSRALRKGDFVRVGDVEGTVTQMGTLSAKIDTPWYEEVTIPNAVLISRTVTNYSRHSETTGVLAATTVTIGYEAPWRQVEALLLLAASRTAGIRRDPAPCVRQTALEDLFVRYTVLVCLEVPRRRAPVMAELHANIQDAFNEHGVQIMAPRYEADPAHPKVVPKDRWFASPAGEARTTGQKA